jgi:hypothetical protein
MDKIGNLFDNKKRTRLDALFIIKGELLWRSLRVERRWSTPPPK